MQKLYWMRTSPLAKNRCAQARPHFWIPPQNQGKHSGTPLRASHHLASSEPFCSFKEYLYDTARTYFIKNSWEYPHNRTSVRWSASVQSTELFQRKRTECANTNADSVLRNNFAGGGFAKPRLMFLKFGRIRVSAPQEGAGGMRGGFFFGFLADGHKNRKYRILKSRRSRDTVLII